MPLMFLVFLHNFSAGLALYMTVSNLLMRHPDEAHQIEPAGRQYLTTVSARLTPLSKRKNGSHACVNSKEVLEKFVMLLGFYGGDNDGTPGRVGPRSPT